MEETDIRQFKNEVNIMWQLQHSGEMHPSIVKMHHYYEDPKRFLLVLDICNGNNLLDTYVINRKEKTKFDE